ncbi:hypothetical protein ACU5AY_06625 [Rhizobium sp. PAMB 3174]
MSGAPQIATVPADLALDLSRLVEAMSGFEGRWWIIGSAAMALHGVEGIDPNDIDILVSADDARRLSTRWKIEPFAMPPHPRFRSEVFLRKPLAAREAEVMGGFEVMTVGGWTPVEPRDRIVVSHAGGMLYVPSIAEIIDMCRQFGREKDLARLVLLARLPQ